MKLKERDPAKHAAIVQALKEGKSIREVAVQCDSSPGTVQTVRFEIPNEDLPTFKKRMSGKYAVALEKLTDRLIEQAASAKGVKDISIAIGVTQDKKALYDGDAGQVIRVEHIELPSINDLIDLLPSANVSQVTDVAHKTIESIAADDGSHNRSTGNIGQSHRGAGVATDASGETTTD